MRSCACCSPTRTATARAALSNEQIAGELSWKPAGTSVRELLDELRRAGWLTARGNGPERRFELTRKGRGRARELAHAGSAPDSEARVSEPDELLDLIYADSTPCAISFSGDATERIPGVWHRPTVQAAARLSTTELCELEVALRAAGLIGEPIHSYGTLTLAGERRARERWHASRPRGAFGGPPRLARPYRRARLDRRARTGPRVPELRRARQLADTATHEALGRAPRPRRGRLQLPTVRGALDDLPRAHQPRGSV